MVLRVPARRAACLRTVRYLKVENGVGVARFGESLPTVSGDGRIEVSDAEFGRFVFLHAQGLIEQTVRSFPLRTQTLHLPIPEGLDYGTALALLKAIEAKSWKNPPAPKRQPGDFKWAASGGPALGSEDLPCIESLHRKKPAGRIEVRTRAGDSRQNRGI
jgi:hypothetical protein